MSDVVPRLRTPTGGWQNHPCPTSCLGYVKLVWGDVIELSTLHLELLAKKQQRNSLTTLRKTLSRTHAHTHARMHTLTHACTHAYNTADHEKSWWNMHVVFSRLCLLNFMTLLHSHAHIHLACRMLFIMFYPKHVLYVRVLACICGLRQLCSSLNAYQCGRIPPVGKY